MTGNDNDLSWIVTVADDAIDRIGPVVEVIRNRGAAVGLVLPVTGIIRCRCDRIGAGGITMIDGVVSVEREAVADPSPSVPETSLRALFGGQPGSKNEKD